MIDETDIKFFVWDRLDDTIEQIFEDLAYDELAEIHCEIYGNCGLYGRTKDAIDHAKEKVRKVLHLTMGSYINDIKQSEEILEIYNKLKSGKKFFEIIDKQSNKQFIDTPEGKHKEEKNNDELKTATDRLYKKFDELIDEIRKLKKENSFTEGDRVYFTGGKHYD